MRFQILHESPGRVRLKALQYSMSMEQADLLEAWILTLPGVDQVTVHERLSSLIIVFHGDRKVLYTQLSRFTYEEAGEEAHVLSANRGGWSIHSVQFRVYGWLQKRWLRGN